ncbi:hypothetical protein DZ936_030200, partial [Pseudomonas aeruginosa]|nr:hypothetical protein [Pseudomonas aeruginosa]
MPPIDDPFGTPAGGGNGSPPDDRTMIMPRPGGRAPEPAGGPRVGDHIQQRLGDGQVIALV